MLTKSSTKKATVTMYNKNLYQLPGHRRHMIRKKTNDTNNKQYLSQMIPVMTICTTSDANVDKRFTSHLSHDVLPVIIDEITHIFIQKINVSITIFLLNFCIIPSFKNKS